MSNKFLTVIYDMSRPGMQQKASLLLLEADWTASGWSHAFADRDEARKELYRLQESISAAPQVVADKRELPVATWFAIDHADGVQFHPSEEQALRYSESGQCVKYFSEDQMRTILHAAPVQVQEPWIDKLSYDAQVDEWAIEKSNLEREIEGLKSRAPVQAQEPVACKTCGGAGIVSDGEINAYPDGTPYMNGPVKCVKDCPDCAKPVAPVQPVAVPDGPYTFPIGEDGEYMILDKDGRQVGTVLYYHHAKAIAAALAAPAAQGDKK